MDVSLNRAVGQEKITLTFLNFYASLLLETPTLTVLFDPVEVNLTQEKIDVIVVTHEHTDHFAPALLLDLQHRTGATILTTLFIARILAERAEKIRAFQVGEALTIKGVRFQAEYAAHAANQPLSFLLSTTGFSLYHPSDSKPFPGMKIIKENHKPELLISTGNSLADTVEIAQLVKPKVLVTNDLRFRTLEIPGVRIRTIKPGESYRYPEENM